MTELELNNRIDEILSNDDDPEKQHSMEDNLDEELINEYVPQELLKELDRLRAADFPRWCA